MVIDIIQDLKENLQTMTTYIPSMKNRITFTALSTSGYTKLRVTQATACAFEYIYVV